MPASGWALLRQRGFWTKGQLGKSGSIRPIGAGKRRHNIPFGAEIPSHVRLVEVGPRDGLQNEALPLAVRDKVCLIDQLGAAGLRTIECGSFVDPKRVAQMADTAAVFKSLKRLPSVSYTALVPNLRGLEAAVAAGLQEIAVFVAASESFSQANIQCSIEEGLLRVEEVVSGAVKNRMRIRAYLSCALGCPFEGAIPISRVTAIAQKLLALGCYEVSLGDTIGVGTPLKTQQLLASLLSRVPVEKLAVHFHDTWGQALANIFAALQLGISVVDCSVAGLGGCPYAPGATGNVATEDVVYMLNGMEVETGVDLELLSIAGRDICARLGRPSGSKAALALGSRVGRCK